ncbi:methyltransferase [Thermodesulfobacteriota bacterium]
MNRQNLPPEFEMMKIIMSEWISKPVYVAAKLGLSDLLSKKNRHVDELAELTATHADSLYRMMRALASVGIYKEHEDHVFGNTPMSESLMEGGLKSIALMFHSGWHSAAWNNLFYSIQTGKPAFEKIHGEPIFNWLNNNPQALRVFNEANSIKAAKTHRLIVEVYDFKRFKTITDVGGGIGGLMVEILKANPHLSGVVADLPETVSAIKTRIPKSDIGDRMQVITIDFFKSIPKGSDVYLLSHILHDWPDEKCIRILRNCKYAMSPHGKLLIVEGIIKQKNIFSIAKQLDLEVFLMGGGRERTEKEYGELLKQAGLSLAKVVSTPDYISVIEAVCE